MTVSAEHVLERRLRRLLACYPDSYRAAHADEMLGVAMAGAGSGQRWPGPGETASLLAGAIRKRLGVVPAGFRNVAWRRAAAALTIIGSLLLASAAARALIFHGFRVDGAGGGLPRGAIAELAGWTLVAVAACLRWRWIAAVASLAGFASEVVRYWDTFPATLMDGWWTMVLAACIALAALAAVPERDQVLSRRALAVLATAAVVLAGWAGVRALADAHGAHEFIAIGPHLFVRGRR